MVQMSGGEVPEPSNAAAGMCYVSLQELATRISHRNTGALIEDKAGYDIMRRVAIDENHHFLFYRDIAQAGFEADPSAMVLALEDEVINFAMPGTGIPDFGAHAKLIARAGIYDLVAHYEQISRPGRDELLGSARTGGPEWRGGSSSGADRRLHREVRPGGGPNERTSGRPTGQRLNRSSTSSSHCSTSSGPARSRS